jgi:hypothetical protein
MSDAVTLGQLQAWQSAVHADRSVPPHAFWLAFALCEVADGSGFIGPSALAKIARTNESGEPITDLLGHLVARGYLEASGNRRKIDGFRIVARVIRARAVRAPKVVPFPAERRGAFIHKHAARIAKLSQSQADAYLRQQLQVQIQTMQRRGMAEDVITGEIRRLEFAIKRELWKCILTPESPA